MYQHGLIILCKQFFSVWHDALRAVMKSYGRDGKLIKLMQAIYSEARSMVMVNGT